MNTAAAHALAEQLHGVGDGPGVYLMKGESGEILYVGKSASLKKRLTAYFSRPHTLDAKTSVLVGKIHTFETILTGTEKEALILESNLIKRHRPRYNVFLKDGKRYPSLRIDSKAPYPALTIIRKPRPDGALYFGPYSSAQAVRRSVKFINKTFRLRKCGDREFRSRGRPCIHYQMDACLAPCCLEVDPAAYAEVLKEVVWFLKGRTPALIEKVKAEMMRAAQAEDFETAARLRDKMFALTQTLERQISVTNDFMDRDVLTLVRSPGLSLVTLLSVRGGYLWGTRHFEIAETFAAAPEIIEAFLKQYYLSDRFISPEILVSDLPENPDLLGERLTEARGGKVKLYRPHRGEKARLLRTAAENAEKELENRLTAALGDQETLFRLQQSLLMDRPPARIECFDNSNLAGTEPVSGMVVFTDGRADKSAYRTYQIKQAKAPDDYAAMAEVLTRRFGKGADSLPYPDLLLVDGGKGQLSIAVDVLRKTGIHRHITLAGIAKGGSADGSADRVFLPGRKNPVKFEKDRRAFLLLLRIRDEAHRFALAYHRKRRRKSTYTSALDEIPGIGPKRKRMLLKRFGSLKGIREAPLSALMELPGITESLARTLRQEPPPPPAG